MNLSEEKNVIIDEINRRFNAIPPSLRKPTWRGFPLELLPHRALVNLHAIIVYELKSKALERRKEETNESGSESEV